MLGKLVVELTLDVVNDIKLLCVVLAGLFIGMFIATIVTVLLRCLHALGISVPQPSKNMTNAVTVTVACTIYAAIAYNVQCHGNNPHPYCPS